MPVFWLLPARGRMSFLGAVSVVCIVSIAPFSGLALTAWTLVFFYLSPYAVKGRWGGRRLLSILVLSILGFLAYFKYIPPLAAALSSGRPADALLIPLGISYYSFKLVHYGVEVARDRITTHSLSDFFTYIFLFPIFTAGPIERFDHFLGQRSHAWNSADTINGVSRIIQGLVKRFVIAGFIEYHAFERLTSAELVSRPTHFYSTELVWLYHVCFYLHVYFDFSAYSDIAIGSSRLFGLRIMENFNWPILARNFGDFWKRWHATLGGWCQSYVYLPLIGLYRRPYLALYGSFIVFALWHEGSLTRLAWGLFHASGVALYVFWTRWRRRRGAVPRVRAWQVVPAWLFPQVWMVLASTFVIAGEGGGGLYDALRLLAKLIGLNLTG